MKTTRIYLLVFVLFSLCSVYQVNGQTDFATIKKNLNLSAHSLKHDLNKTKDSLKLESSNYIYRIYTVGENGGMVDVRVNRKKYDLSLRELVKGKHVFVVQELGKKIIFQVYINQDNWQDKNTKVGEANVKSSIKINSNEATGQLNSTVTSTDGGSDKME